MRRSFESHILPVLEECKPKTLLEIGVLRGDNTLKLLEWCSQNNAFLTSLDPVAWEGNLPEDVKQPSPGYKYKRGQEGFEEWHIIPEGLEEVYCRGLDRYWCCLKTRSVEYLDSPQFDGFDAYFIDGDHNYYTVTRELELIHQHGKPGDIALFNDVAGIWARKDLYYDPEFIPEEYRNGPKQGVLTAIEDFLESLAHKRLWKRVRCPYEFKVLTKKNDGIGLLKRIL